LHLFILVIYRFVFSAGFVSIFWILDFLEFLAQVHPDETF